MKLVPDFDKFLEEEVNLNKSRISTLTDRVEAIEGFLQGSDWGGIIERFRVKLNLSHAQYHLDASHLGRVQLVKKLFCLVVLALVQMQVNDEQGDGRKSMLLG